MMTLCGKPVILSAVLPVETPKMRLSVMVSCSDEFREKTDQWLDEFFGRRPYIVEDAGGAMWMHPQTYAMLAARMSYLNKNMVGI